MAKQSDLAAGLRDILKQRRPETENDAAGQPPSHPPETETPLGEVVVASSSEGKPALANHPGGQAPETLKFGRRLAKSNDPDFVRITAYIRRNTDTQVRQKVFEQGRREISDVVQALLEGWVEGRFQA